MATSTPDWQIRGVYHETCASEGHCPYYFGRDKEGGCRYFMVFRIVDGVADGVDLSGTTVIYVGDLPHATYEEVVTKGSEGAVYIDNSATPQQLSVLEELAQRALGGVLMKKFVGIHKVDVDLSEQDGVLQVQMPAGRMRMELTRGQDGGPVRLENQTLPFLTNVRAAHAPYWEWKDHGRHFEYRERCGTWADFAMVSGE